MKRTFGQKLTSYFLAFPLAPLVAAKLANQAHVYYLDAEFDDFP